jgi:hypothetical protein
LNRTRNSSRSGAWRGTCSSPTATRSNRSAKSFTSAVTNTGAGGHLSPFAMDSGSPRSTRCPNIFTIGSMSVGSSASKQASHPRPCGATGSRSSPRKKWSAVSKS